MGAGKTTIGKKLALRLGYRFIDTDQQVEFEQQCTVKDLFREKGEVFFRSLESDVLRRLISHQNVVLATGGGILTTAGNLELLKQIGAIIYLKADFEDIFERVSRNKKRPLLQTENPKETIQKLLGQREPLYDQADFIVPTQSRNIRQTASFILRQLSS